MMIYLVALSFTAVFGKCRDPTPLKREDWQRLAFVYQTCFQAKPAVDDGHEIIRFNKVDGTLCLVTLA